MLFIKKTIILFFFFFNISLAYGQVSLFRVNNYSGPAAPPSLVTQGLVLHLDAGNVSSYTGTGTTWTDLSGNGSNGTLVNTITYNASNQGYLVFNGNATSTNPYVSLNPSPNFDFGAGDFTVEMWVYITTVNSHPNFLSINVNASAYAALRFGYYLGNLGISHSYTGTAWDVQTGTALTINAWQHIVLSRIAGSANLYLNGVSKLVYSLPGTLMTNQETVIGTLSAGFTPVGYFNLSGNIAITKFYKGKGLSASEVTTHFNLYKSRFGL
jgi:Concanavalin A-like lectin/glucanases superfamily